MGWPTTITPDTMAIPRRLRFEILRRDGYRCRYCGATSDQTSLTVDHVLPESLGGLTEPANLVTACAACNSGKSSVVPDQPIVEEVAHDAQRWARAVEVVAAWRQAEYRRMGELLDWFDDCWDDWTFGPSKQPIPRPSDWRLSVEKFIELGLDSDGLRRFIDVAMNAQHVHPTQTWVYFCGCCWAEIRLIQQHAAGIIEDEERGL